MARHPGFSLAVLIAVLLLMATAAVAAASSIEAPRCDGVKLRTGPSTANTVKAVIGTSSTVTVDTQVPGSAWQTLCAGHSLSGSTWARISAVDGKTTQARYGVPYVYAAAGLLQVVATASPTPRASTPAPPTAPPATPAPSSTLEPATPSPSPAAPSSPAGSTAPAATASGGARSSVGPAGPGTTQTGSPSDPFGSPVATVVLVLAVLSTTLSWVAVFDRRRRRGRRMPVTESLPASRMEDVLH